ncbi:MAG: SDR family oxidoreductase [Frankia sp.]
MKTVLLTGADGVVGSEVRRQLRAYAPSLAVVGTSRRGPESPDRVRWDIGREPAPPRVAGPWDVIVHTAASTRWTMTRSEAVDANVVTTRAVLALAGPRTHLVHVSTAYVGGHRSPEDLVSDEFEGYRNGYEWSKALCEQLVTDEHGERLTVVRPPLILGRRGDGGIERFSGPYTLLQSLVSGLAAVVVGDPAGYAEIAPVDEVANAVVDAVRGPAAGRRLEVIAAGEGSLRLADLLSVACTTLNTWRAARGIAPITAPPIVATSRWRRFFLPLARLELSEVQNHAVELLGMFESYTSLSEPFTPTRTVTDPAAVLERSVWRWADTRPRLAGRIPESWALVPAGS